MTNNTYLLSNLHAPGSGLTAEDSLPSMLGNENDYLTTRVSFKLNLTGPSINVQSACSTSLVAITQAYQSLMLYGCDMALAGGVSVSFPQQDGYVFQEGGIGSPDGHCRPFDANAQGTVFSNGVGVVALKRVEDAIADGDTIYAVIRGGALNNDGAAKMSFAAPSVDGQAEVIATAQAIADVEPDTVTYVECHGTATPIGDPIEVAALTQAFRERTDATGFCALGSVKSNFGHLDSAAGVAAFIKTVLCLHHGKIPPTLHYRSPNPQIDFASSPFYVADRLIDWQSEHGVRRAGVSGFGIGGTNAHVVLEQAPPVDTGDPVDEAHTLLLLSAKSAAALADNANNLGAHLASVDAAGVGLKSVASTLTHGRARFRSRLAVTAGNAREAADLLGKIKKSSRSVCKAFAAQPQVALMFPGGGSQYVHMGLGLYETYPEFAAHVDAGLQRFAALTGTDLRELWFPSADAAHAASETFERPSLQLPAIFIFQHALARLWQSWGLEPTALIGHSLGENTAACIAGVMSFDATLGLVSLRGQLFEEVEAGGMLSVAMSAAELEPLLVEGADLATVNAPEQCTVSGPLASLKAMEAIFAAREVEYQRIPIAIAAHSALLDPILDRFHNYLKNISLSPANIPIVSNRTGTWLSAKEAQDPGYWVAHLRNTVRFADGVQCLFEAPERVLLEVGPGKILGSLAKLTAPERAQAVVTSTRHPQESVHDQRALLNAAGQLWSLGLELNWDDLQNLHGARRVRLPTYAFQRQRYLIEPDRQAQQPPAVMPEQPVVPVAAPTPAAAIAPAPTEPMETSPMQSRYDFVVNRLTSILHELSGIPVEDIDANDSFIDMGFDSLFLTQANLRFKKEFKVKITFRQLFEDAPTINALAQFIDDKLPEDAFADELAAAAAPVSPAATAEATPAAAAGATPMAVPSTMDDDPLRAAIALQIQASNALLQAMQGGVAAPAATPQPAPAAAPTPAVAAPTTIKAASAENVSQEQMVAARALGPYKPIDNSASAIRLSNEGRNALEDFIEAYCARTARSKELSATQRAYLSDARSISGFRQEWKEIVYQIAAGKGSKGSRIYDLDGNEYIDLTSGFGINLFGYSPEATIAAAHQQLDDGIELGTLSPLAAQAAKMITELTGMDRCTFTNTGSEAISAAIRAARTTTGRDMIAVFYDEYHGISDEVLVNIVKTEGGTQTVPTSPGIPQSIVDQVIVLQWDDPACMETIKAYADDLAAVIVEPVQNRNPSLKTSTRFAALREVTKDNDIALIYDEMITGFRLAQGGAQEYFGVEADMVCYGKIVGGGMPTAVVAGRGEYLDCFDGGPWQFGDDSFPEAGVTFFGGTYTRHPIALATAVPALKQVKEVGKEGYLRLNTRSRAFANRLNEILVSRGFPARIESCESIFNLKFNDDNPYSRLIFWQLRHRGVLIYDRPFFISMAHSDADFDFVAQQFIDSIDALQAGDIVPRCSANGVYEDERFVAFNTAQSEVFLATDLGASASRAFHEQVIYRFEGELDLPALRHAIQRVVYKHDGLRARVAPEADGFIVSSALHTPLEVIELAPEADEQARDAEFRRLLREDFDLQQGPLVRFTLLRQSGADVLVITAHHIVIDGWSMGILLMDLAGIYDAVSNQERCLPVAEHQLQDFIDAEDEYRASEEFAETEAFWESVYAGSRPEPINLPLDRPRPWEQSYQGQRHAYRFGAELTAQVREFSQQHKCTPFTTLFTVFTRWLVRTTRQRDLVIAVPMAGQAVVGMPSLVGHSVSFLPLRVQIEENEPFEVTLDNNRKRILEANDNQRYTYLDLLKTLDIKRDPSRPPLAPVSFNVDQGMESFSFGGMEAKYEVCPRDYVKNDMFFNLVEEANEYTLELDRNSDVFDAATMDGWVAQFKEILISVLSDPKANVDALELENAAGNQELLRSWNDTGRDYPLDFLNLVSAFEASVDRNPDAQALRLDGQSLRYAELDRAANKVANYLLDNGLELEDRVVLVMERSFELLAAIYGVLKAGGAYVPLDPEMPPARILEAAEDSAARHAIVQDRFTALIGEGLQVLIADAPTAAHLQASEDRPSVALQPHNLAYVIYTSGTTGRPKGVMNEHRAVLNRLLWGQEYFSLEPGDRHVQKTPYTFDVSVPEIFWPLQVGATLVLARPGGHKEVAYLHELLAQEDINVAHFVPSMLHAFLQHEATFEFPHLRHIYCSGEALSPVLRDQCLALLPDVRLFNLYGPTEAAVEVSYWECERSEAPDPIVPLGHPTPNSKLYILDESMQPLPPGLVGELYIGGDQVARGYLNRDDLTAERFLADPFSDAADARLYRTGDLAMYRPDGVIEYHGRNDAQVKLRGYRIELGEIEAAMDQLTGVISSVAAVRDVSESDQRLIGFIRQESTNSMSSMEMRRQLAQKLPPYMIPQHFVIVDEFPHTSSGKLDRARLLENASHQILETRTIRKIETPAEVIVAQLWADGIQLGVEQISVDDNFFEIGGHSLLAMDVLRSVQRIFGVRLSLKDILFNSLQDFCLLLPEKELEALEQGYAENNRLREAGSPRRGIVRKMLGMLSQNENR